MRRILSLTIFIGCLSTPAMATKWNVCAGSSSNALVQKCTKLHHPTRHRVHHVPRYNDSPLDRYVPSDYDVHVTKNNPKANR